MTEVLTPEIMTDSQESYRALTTGAALLVRPTAGVLRASDADRADFLHRMTTNDINRLTPGRTAVTILTSPTARISYIFTVVSQQDDLLLLPSPGEAALLDHHLRGQIFFMDNVKIADLSKEYQRLRVMGPEAADVLTNSGFPVQSLEDDAWIAAELDGGETAIVLKQSRYDVPGFEMIVPTAMLSTVQSQLTDAGAVPIDEDTYEAYRIELGRPAPGHELTDVYNPLEAGLHWACSDDKGCYTGQEIIARQITYDKITKSLVGIRSEQSLAVGTDLRVDGRSVGTVTSSSQSPTLDAPIALAIVKRPHQTVGTELTTEVGTAAVVDLPFVA